MAAMLFARFSHHMSWEASFVQRNAAAVTRAGVVHGRPEIRAFCWAALMRDGWRDASPAIPPEVAPSLAFQRGISCLVKDIDREIRSEGCR